jgi:hypothetical protein
MKVKIFALAALFAAVVSSGCFRDECTSEQSYTRFDPVYKPFSEIRTDLVVESARSLNKPGKMFSLGQYLFINELMEGIHVIDNSDPENPKNLAFWKITGNVDMAVHNGYLYADQYVDLLTLDISDLANPKVVCRSQNAFNVYDIDPVQGLIVDYKETQVIEKLPCNDARVTQTWFQEGDMMWVSNSNAFIKTFDGSNSSGLKVVRAATGKGGSFARFGLDDKFLYTVDNWLLRSWSLSSPACPSRTDSLWLGWNIETIFPWKNRLFVGSQTGVFILNNSNQGHPVMEASFNHASGCDPVVCDDNYAYVTIHDGTTCNGTFNQLDVIGLQNLPAANLLKTFQMKRPMGLSITNDHLFLCDEGLKIFDRNDPVELKEIAHIKGIAAYDVISFTDNHLLLIGDDGFFQYDVSDPAAPKQLSLIPVVR